MEKANANGSQLTPYILMFAMAQLVKRKIGIQAPHARLASVRESMNGFDLEVVENNSIPKDEVHLVNIFGQIEVKIFGLS